MQFYEITCKVTNEEIFENPENENDKYGRAKRERNEVIAHKTETFNDEFADTFYCFLGDLDGGSASLGLMMDVQVEVPMVVGAFLSYIGIETEEIAAREVTFHRMSKMLRYASRNNYINDEDDALDKFDLGQLHNMNAMLFGENMIDPCTKEELLDAAGDFLAKNTLREEIERIYAKPAGKTYGHPVHYIFQTNDRTVRREMYKLILRALYDNGRLKSRRYCFIDVDPGERFSAGNINALYDSCESGAMVIRISGEGESLGDRVTDIKEKMSAIGDIANNHKNSVLTVICLPQESRSIKNFLMEESGNMSFVEICEEPVPVSDAADFLKKIAKDSKIRTNKKLFAKLEEGQTYLTPELVQIFDEWYDDKLKTSLYPQYKDISTSKEKVKKTVPKGDAYSRLQGMIGLASAKEVIDNAIDYFKAQKLFREKGMKLDQPSMHMVFTGNPGTAKTTVARLFATIMRDNHVLSEGQLVEVGRADLVGKYVGHTAPRVKEAFKKAIGGVLFIDEAYSLVDDKDGLFGDEAINTIVQEMENNRDRLIVIFAGYPDKMEKFLEKNPGLRSRIAFHVNFDDYNTDELLSIADMIADEKGLKLDTAAHKKLHVIFDEAKENPDFGNGRFVRNMIEKSRMCQASRLVKMDYDKVTKKDIMTLCEDDIQMPKKLNEGKKKTMGFCS